MHIATKWSKSAAIFMTKLISNIDNSCRATVVNLIDKNGLIVHHSYVHVLDAIPSKGMAYPVALRMRHQEASTSATFRASVAAMEAA